MVNEKQISRVMWAIRLMRQGQADITAAAVLNTVSGYWTDYTDSIVQECMDALEKRGFHITEYPPGIPSTCIIVTRQDEHQESEHRA